MTAKLIPQVSEWLKERVAGVLICDKPLNSPARSKGQHQLPTRAGMESTIVQIATHVETLSETSAGSSAFRCCDDAGSASSSGGPHPTHSSSGGGPVETWAGILKVVLKDFFAWA